MIRANIGNSVCSKIPPLALMLCAGAAQAVEPANGTAIVRVAAQQYTIPVVCDAPSTPESGVFTEPQRITRERTGRTSGVRLTIRRWKETTDVVVSLDRYVAWVASPPSSGGVLEMSLAMSPVSSLNNGMPALLTYDEWQAGVRPAGLDDVHIEVNCNRLDPAAPAFRKLPAVDKGQGAI